MSRRIINTNIRLNLEREEDRRAWEHLQRLDRKAYKSYSRVVVAAINDFFGRQKHDHSDNTEDAFIQRLREVLRQELQGMSPAFSLMQLLQGAAPTVSASSSAETLEQQEAVDAALDFVDSF